MNRLCSMALAIAGGWFAHAANPFWYNNADPATNRVEVGIASADGECVADFRLWSVSSSKETTFTTYPCGLMFIIR